MNVGKQEHCRHGKPHDPWASQTRDVRQQLIELLGRTDGLLGRKRVEDEGLELLLRAFEGRKGRKKG